MLSLFNVYSKSRPLKCPIGYRVPKHRRDQPLGHARREAEVWRAVHLQEPDLAVPVHEEVEAENLEGMRAVRDLASLLKSELNI